MTLPKALIGLLASTSLLFAATPANAQAAPCQFQNGFAIVAGMIPNSIGSCVSDQRPANDQGDTMQETTNGLLTWTKATNVTEFTTGSHTYVYSSYGLILRDGMTSYPWEGITSLVAGVAINSAGQVVDPTTGQVIPTDAHIKTS